MTGIVYCTHKNPTAANGVLSVTPDPQRLVGELRRVCKPGGRIVILNHFSGGRFWWLLGSKARGLADKLGFRSEFSIDTHIRAQTGRSSRSPR